MLEEPEDIFDDKEFISEHFPFLCGRDMFSSEINRKDDWTPYITPFECQKGWHDLLYETFEKLKQLLKDNDLLDKYTVSQIKSKYGELCIYGYLDISISNDKIEREIYKIYDVAAAKSRTICEFCGKPGKCDRYDGWVYTICDDCASNLDKIFGRE